MDYAVKLTLGTAVAGVLVRGTVAGVLVLERQKTMYGGKKVGVGDRVFVFDRAAGLVAWGGRKPRSISSSTGRRPTSWLG